MRNKYQQLPPITSHVEFSHVHFMSWLNEYRTRPDEKAWRFSKLTAWSCIDTSRFYSVYTLLKFHLSILVILTMEQMNLCTVKWLRVLVIPLRINTVCSSVLFVAHWSMQLSLKLLRSKQQASEAASHLRLKVNTP